MLLAYRVEVLMPRADAYLRAMRGELLHVIPPLHQVALSVCSRWAATGAQVFPDLWVYCAAVA